MLHDRDIICISSIDWDFIWQGHQEIMAALAAQGNRVLFMENTGVRPPGLRDLPRLGSRLKNWRRGVGGFREERENLFVYSPIVLPFPYSALAVRLNAMLLLRALRRWMYATGAARRPIVWTFLPTPLVHALLRGLDPELSVYYCIDDFAASSRGARRIVRSEEKLFHDADLVFVTSEQLRRRALLARQTVHLFPFGVDYPAFEAIRKGDEAAPDDVRDLPRPIIGYVGGLHQWVDQALLGEVADRMPEASVVLVGPIQADVAALASRPNVHLLGARSHADVPRYIKAFDVGLVPYRLSDYTANVYPTKLNEYLALGVPVVSTDLAEIQRFNRTHGDVVAVGRDPEAFAGAVREAVGASPPAEVERRVEIARSNSWDARVARMADLMEEALIRRARAVPRWEERLRGLYRSGRRRLLQTATLTVGLYLALFHTPLVWVTLAPPLKVVEAPRRADAIVVFAGGVGERGQVGGGYQERVKHAVDLYHAGHASHLVFSSGFVFAFREAEVMKSLAVSLGVPARDIVLEQRAANTWENVTFTRGLLAREGWRSVLLVSSPYHMRRAVLTFRKAAPEVEVIPTPAPNSQFYQHGNGATLEQILGLVHEYVGIADYWRKGWL
jgi:uncharacterized SAM-binding protein YcdF (DUF218 family)/glycosyltransferase involved in cell wall biosynthesis